MSTPDTESLPPVEKSLTIPLDVEAAFARFTDQITEWWPLATHSIGGEKAVACVFEARAGGRIFERWQDGTTRDWGTVLAFERPHRVVFTWHPGRNVDTAQEVEVRFTADGRGTRVALIHRGWERLGDAAAATRAEYGPGWDYVLGRFAAQAAGV